MTQPLKILVMGGTRFFGKRLVHLLLDEGHRVTVATRGQTADPFGEQVERLVLDRFDKASLAAVGQQEWDVVYDQICFSSTDAAEASEILAGKVGRYIMTSSLSVYDQVRQADMTEEQVDTANYPIQMGRMEAFGYAEGKRLAEAVFLQRADFPVAAVRIPIVFGPDDYTRRLHTPVLDIRAGQPIQMGPPGHLLSYISAAEAANFLRWLATNPLEGTVNACSNGAVASPQLVRLIEEATGQSATIEPADEDTPFSVLNLRATLTMNTAKAQAAGYQFRDVLDWLVPLIGEIAQS